MADFAYNGEKRLRGVLALRGFGKTTVIPCTLTAYRHGRDRDRRVLVVSKKEDEAKKTLNLIREWYDRVWFLKHLAPLKGQRDAATYFDVAGTREDRHPSMSVCGIEGQLEGRRAHTILPDDVETKTNTKSIETRTELRRLCAEFKNILYPQNEWSEAGLVDPMEIVYVGTPKHEETLYLNRIQAGYDFRAYPIMLPFPDQKVINLAPIIQKRLDRGDKPGTPISRRFPQSEIDERRAEGLTDFLMESMLVANLGEMQRYPLRLNDLIVMDVNPEVAPTQVVYGTRDNSGSTEIPTSELPHDGFGDGHLYRPAFIGKDFAPYVGTYAYVDPAGRGEDRTGLSIVSNLGGMLFGKGCYGLLGGAGPERMEEITRLCRLANASLICVEDNIDVYNTFTENLTVEVARQAVEAGTGWHASVERRKSQGKKEPRIIAALEPVSSTHRLVMDRSCFRPGPNDRPIDSLAYQWSRMCKDVPLKEDGKIDSLASCVKEWQHTLRIDPVVAARTLDAQAALDKIRRAHAKAAAHRPPERAPSWIRR